MKYLLTGETTSRLEFRLLSYSDFYDWIPLFETENIVPFLGLDRKLSVRGRCECWFDKAFSRYENDEGGMNVLVIKETGRMVGQSGLLIQDMEGQKRMEIGYSILPQYWRMGYALEAAQKSNNFTFENSFTSRLMSMAHPKKSGSARVAIKKNRTTLKKHQESFEGTPVNLFSIEKKNWLSQQTT